MKYCLSVGIHNLFFEIAIVSDNHQIILKNKIYYDRNKDIASNVFNAYKKYFNEYKISHVGVAISNNIDFKGDFLYKVKAFSFNRYNLYQSLFKLFKLDISIIEETHATALALSYKMNVNSLLYVLLDNKISNSIVVDNSIIDLEDDINLKLDTSLNDKCSKDAIKSVILKNNYDDEYVGGYFLSRDVKVQNMISRWVNNIEISLKRVLKEIPVENIVFGGNLGEYYNYFASYFTLSKKIISSGIFNHRDMALIGISHLIFKDK